MLLGESHMNQLDNYWIKVIQKSTVLPHDQGNQFHYDLI